MGPDGAVARAARVALAGDRASEGDRASTARRRRRGCSAAGSRRGSATPSRWRSTSASASKGIDVDGKPAPFPPGRPTEPERRAERGARPLRPRPDLRSRRPRRVTPASTGVRLVSDTRLCASRGARSDSSPTGVGLGQTRSSETTSSCRRPFVATKLAPGCRVAAVEASCSGRRPPRRAAAPGRSPTGSSPSRTRPRARPRRPGSAARSRPARGSTTRAARAPPPGRHAARATSSTPTQSSSARDRDTAQRVPSANAPPPRTAHQRRPSAGAETSATSTAPSRSSASSVAHTGTPRT